MSKTLYGGYLIADDSLREKFSANTDVLAVVGHKEGKGFQAEFKIRKGVCNIKSSGPELVVLK
jgi:hypothetical protein